MADMKPGQDGENGDQRGEGNTDRRGDDRRQSTKPYTGPERRKHERRDS